MRGQPDHHDQLRTPSRPQYPPKCNGCKCETCTQNQKTLNDIKDMMKNKINVKIVGSESAKSVNLCESTSIVEDLVINYTYTDQGRQMMILDIGGPVSVAGIPWIKSI